MADQRAATKCEAEAVVQSNGTVLVPTDFSEEFCEGLRYAAAMTRAPHAALHVVHCDGNRLGDPRSGEPPSFQREGREIIEPSPLASFQGRTATA